MSDPAPLSQAQHRLGAAFRRLAHHVVGHEAPHDLVVEAASTLDHLSERFARHPGRSRNLEDFGHHETEPPPVGSALESFDHRPFSGRSSPWGTGLSVHRTERGVEAVVTLGPSHEGAPQRSHGGIVAGIFDDVTGFVLQVASVKAFTGELTVRYEQPTPLGVPLVISAWLDRTEGRKLFVEATAHDGPRRIARCQAIFITVTDYAVSGE